jgi:hypothetical protein
MIPKISRFPFFGKRFFRRARKIIGCCHYSHFWRLVILIASDSERRSLSRCQEVSGNHRPRQAISFFLTQADWDAPELLRQKALDTLRELGWRAGELVHLILDDTQQRKRAKQMAAVSKLFLHAEKVYATGHTIVGCALLYRGVVIPYAVRLWANEEFCAQSQKPGAADAPVEFQKITAIAAQMVADFSLPGKLKVIVLFDAYYLCPVVTRACEAQKFGYVGVAKRNRNFFPHGRDRDKRKVGRYGANVLAKDGRQVSVEGKKHRLAERVGRLSRLGQVKLVFSRRPGERGWIAMATNQLRWGMKTVLTHYLKRWGIEVFWKTSKQNLGLGDYQFLRYRAVERYLHLVLIAHLLLTHLGITAPDAQANQKDKHKELPLPSVPQLQQNLRALLLNAVLRNMERGSQQRRITQKLKDILQF